MTSRHVLRRTRPEKAKKFKICEEKSNISTIKSSFDRKLEGINFPLFFAFSDRVRSKMCRKAMILYSKVALMLMSMFRAVIRHKNDFFVLASIGNQHCSQKSTQKGKNNGPENRDFGRFLKRQF